MDGSEDLLIDDQIPLKEVKELWCEAVEIQFDDEGEDSDLDFEGFCDPENDE